MMTYREFIEQTMMCGDTLATVEGVPPLSLPKSKGEALKDYRVYGQSQQNGTPTPESPVAVESVGNRILPEGYKRLEYIEGDGLSYLDTGVRFNDINKIELGWASSNTSKNDVIITGSGSQGDYIWIGYSNTNTVVSGGYDNITISPSVSYLDKITRHDIICNFTTWRTNLIIIGYYPQYSFNQARKYYCFKSYYKISNELACNFIPSQRLSDNAVGMYDLVSNTFFENQGTGSFIAGPDAPDYEIPLALCNNPAYEPNLPQEYQQVEYLESHGTEYIQLNYGFYKTDEVDFKFSEVYKKQTGDKYMVSPSSWNTNNNRFAMGRHGENYVIGYGSVGTGNTGMHPSTRYLDNLPHTWHYKDYLFSVEDPALSNNVSSIIFGSETTNLKLFYGYNSNTKGAIYYWRHKKVIDGVLTLVEDLVPARRKSDSVLGMYDLVTNTFFTNQGTGTFTCGADINGTTTNIYLNAPLRKIGNYADYIDFKQRLRHTEVSEDADSSEKSIAEGLHPVIPPTEKSITLPSVPTMRGQCYFKVLTDVTPSNSQVKYLK